MMTTSALCPSDPKAEKHEQRIHAPSPPLSSVNICRFCKTTMTPSGSNAATAAAPTSAAPTCCCRRYEVCEFNFNMCRSCLDRLATSRAPVCRSCFVQHESRNQLFRHLHTHPSHQCECVDPHCTEGCLAGMSVPRRRQNHHDHSRIYDQPLWDYC